MTTFTVWMVHKRLWGLGWLGFRCRPALATVPEHDYTIPFGQSRHLARKAAT